MNVSPYRTIAEQPTKPFTRLQRARMFLRRNRGFFVCLAMSWPIQWFVTFCGGFWLALLAGVLAQWCSMIFWAFVLNARKRNRREVRRLSRGNWVRGLA